MRYPILMTKKQVLNVGGGLFLPRVPKFRLPGGPN